MLGICSRRNVGDFRAKAREIFNSISISSNNSPGELFFNPSEKEGELLDGGGVIGGERLIKGGE